MNAVSRKAWQREATNGATLIAYEGPGITTRSDVKRSVNEGKGIWPIPILKESKQVGKRRSVTVDTGKRGKEEGEEGRGKGKRTQGRGKKYTLSHKVRKCCCYSFGAINSRATPRDPVLHILPSVVYPNSALFTTLCRIRLTGSCMS